MDIDEIAASLAALEPTPAIRGRRAAVIVLLTPALDGGLTVPFIRRSYALKLHPGEVSLPGGAWDPADGENLAETALRELHEELGVEPEPVCILGRLPDVSTVVTDFAIAPYVGYLSQRQRWVPSSGEVDEVIEIPLAAILRPGAVRRGTKIVRGQERSALVFDYGPHHIWGATGRILERLVQALTSDRPFVAGHASP